MVNMLLRIHGWISVVAGTAIGVASLLVHWDTQPPPLQVSIAYGVGLICLKVASLREHK